MKIKIGDAEVDATNGEAVRIAVDSLNAKLATYATDKASLEAKVVTLEKQVADAKLTPAQLRDAGISIARRIRPGAQHAAATRR